MRQPPPLTREGGERPLEPARVAEILGRWQRRELQIARSFKECRGLSVEQLEELYQETTVALMGRPYHDEKHLQRAVHKGLKGRALNLHRDERRRREILADHAPAIHALETARNAEASPERFALIHEDRLLVTEFLAELTDQEQAVFLLLAEGMGYNRIAKALAIPANEALNATRACERKSDRFVLLYERGRLCGYRAATIRALTAGEATSRALARLALAHLDACPHCRTEHKTNARRLRRAFQDQAAAALLPVPALAARIGVLSRLALHTRTLQQRLSEHWIAPGQSAVRERSVALLAGSGASAKLAAGILTAAVIAGSITATHALEHHHKHPHHHDVLQARAAPPATPTLQLVRSRFAPHASIAAPRASRTVRKPDRRSPGHVVTTPHQRTQTRARREPGGFAYLGVPATSPPPARAAEPAHTATRTGGAFSP